VDEVRALPQPLGYRNKLELTLGRDGTGRPAIGFHPSGPAAAGLVDVDCCPLQADLANRVLATARKHLLERPEGARSWAGMPDRGHEPFRLVLRTSRHTGQVLVALRETATPFPRAGALARELMAVHPELTGVVRIRARPGRRGGARVLPVRGKDWLTERVGGISFRLPATSFLQVNVDGAELLTGLVRAAAGPVEGKSVIELYGGVGAFAFDLAGRGATVTVCEADVDAVRCGRQAARAAGAERIRFQHTDVTAFLRACVREGRRAGVVVADPPRSGLGARVPGQIAALEPERVVLVSCDPATLARDARRLAAAGYEAGRAIPVDLFPQTAHVETVLAFTRA
jgi:23S rRNA (uracil1939-C5)-methyltransferase